jgi:hypothetical protein
MRRPPPTVGCDSCAPYIIRSFLCQSEQDAIVARSPKTHQSGVNFGCLASELANRRIPGLLKAYGICLRTGGLVLLEPSGLAVQNAEWQVGTLLSLSPW